VAVVEQEKPESWERRSFGEACSCFPFSDTDIKMKTKVGGYGKKRIFPLELFLPELTFTRRPDEFIFHLCVNTI